jgi:hypothetical protein
MDSDTKTIDRHGSSIAKGLLKKALLQRLGNMDVDEGLIPGVMRSLSSLYRCHSNLSTYEVNHRLKYLGWSDLELDHYTWQLAVDFFVEGAEKKKVRR